ncbi:MAG TPA: DMT family transporter [Candidatus Eisenbacteria bacterium]|nr:DMT family transporter [Candidatus Eisenbacteria bacterium]
MPKAKLAILALITATIIWGAGAPIFKWTLESGIPPLLLAFFRFLIPVLLLLPFLKHVKKIRGKDIPSFLALGLLNCIFNIALYFLGLSFAPSINQSIIACAGPIFIIIGSALFLKDRATKKVLLGNVLGLTGVLFIVFQPVKGIDGPLALFGNTLFILSTISASAGTIFSRKLAVKYNAITLLFWTFLISAVCLSPILILSVGNGSILTSLHVRSLIGIIFGGVFSSFTAYLLFYWGLTYMKASETTIFSYIDPVVTVMIAMPLLHEYPSPIYILGSFLVFFGIFVAEGRIHYHPIHLLLRKR